MMPRGMSPPKMPGPGKTASQRRGKQRMLPPELLWSEPDPRSAGPAEKHLRVRGVRLELGGTRVQPVWGNMHLERPRKACIPSPFSISSPKSCFWCPESDSSPSLLPLNMCPLHGDLLVRPHPPSASLQASSSQTPAPRTPHPDS